MYLQDYDAIYKVYIELVHTFQILRATKIDLQLDFLLFLLQKRQMKLFSCMYYLMM